MSTHFLHRQELEIMKIVWRLGQASVTDVQQELPGEPVYTSVATMLKHLEKKGFLDHRVDGRTYLYRPLIERHEVRRSMLGDLLERLFEGSSEQLVNTLLETEQLEPEALDRLKARIATYREEYQDE